MAKTCSRGCPCRSGLASADIVHGWPGSSCGDHGCLKQQRPGDGAEPTKDKDHSLHDHLQGQGAAKGSDLQEDNNRTRHPGGKSIDMLGGPAGVHNEEKAGGVGG